MDSSALLPLHDFFATLGGGAAALLGLLFVAVSINVAGIVKHDDTRELARHTFVTFVGVFLYALFVLLPQSIQQLGVEIAVTSVVLILFTAPRFVQSFFREAGRVSRGAQIRRFGLALLLQVGAFAIGTWFAGIRARGHGWSRWSSSFFSPGRGTVGRSSSRWEPSELMPSRVPGGLQGGSRKPLNNS
jgi:hypothetical protein